MPDWKQYVREQLNLPVLKRKLEDEIVEELATQLEDVYRDCVSSGMSEEEAEIRTRGHIEDWERLAEEIAGVAPVGVSDVAEIQFNRMEQGLRRRGFPWILFADLGWDLRHTLRTFRRSPGLTAILVLTLGLGIGANTAVFSIINALLLRPLPYPEPHELVTINHHYPTAGILAGVSAPGYRDYREKPGSFERVAVARQWSANLTGIGDPERVPGGLVTADYFETYGLTPIMGRSILIEEEIPGSDLTVVISHGFWTRRLGGVDDVIGRSIELNREAYRIIGVMPPDFEDFLNPNREFWVPLALPPDQFSDNYRITENYRLVARLKSDVTLPMAQEEMRAFAETIKASLPGTYPEDWALPVTSLDERAKGPYRATLLLLFGAAGFVLLIICANLANLLLARAMSRRKEVAIRGALGATRRRLIGQLLTESILLSVLGGVAGLILASWGIRALMAVPSSSLAGSAIGMDPLVLLFTLIVAVAAGILFGLAPAFQSVDRNLHRTLSRGGLASVSDHRGRKLRHSLVVAEFAIALILLSGAGLMIQSIARLRNADPGFKTEGILTASLRLPPAAYQDTATRVAFYDRLITTLEAMPGVHAAATTSIIPFSGNWSTTVFSIEGYVVDDSHPRPWGDIRIASPGFEEVLGVPILKGRFFDETDGSDTLPVALIDEVMADRYWPGEDPLGKRIGFGDPQDPEAQWFTIVGVIGHMAYEGMEADRRIQFYFNNFQIGQNVASLVIRTDGEPEAMTSALRSAVLAIDPNQPVSNVIALDALVTDSLGGRQFLMLLLALFAGFALLLAGLGIYGVLSQMVRERSREMGIRVAMGATRSELFRMVVGRGLLLSAVGLLAGIVGSLALTRFLQTQLYEISAFDPATILAVAMILFITALISIAVPGDRASRADPMVNLRAE
jgi:putative ABC transport system permease protein